MAIKGQFTTIRSLLYPSEVSQSSIGRCAGGCFCVVKFQLDMMAAKFSSMSKASFLLGCFLACSLAASAFAQTADAREAEPASAGHKYPKAKQHHRRYHHPNPCMEELPEYYKAQIAGAQGGSHCNYNKRKEQPKEDYYPDRPQGKHHNRDTYDKGPYENDAPYDYSEGPRHEYYGEYPDRDMCPAGPVDIAYKNLLRSNDKYESGTWGEHIDKHDRTIWRLLPSEAAAAYTAAPADAGGYTLPAGGGYGKFNAYSVNPDIPTLHIRGDKAFMINHFEAGQPGSFYKTVITKNEDGSLRVRDTENIDLSKVGSTWFPCSGTVTPWDSHMGSEEYPADCRLYEKTLGNKLNCGTSGYLNACGWVTANSFESNNALALIRYYGQHLHPFSDQDRGNRSSPVVQDFERAMGLANQNVLDEFRAKFNCYNYGSSPEISVNFEGRTHVTKWRTLGRVAHESALVMPDLRTIYTTDDGSNCGFFMFKADRKADLSCGTLYAARLEADGAATSDKFKVKWIELGYATQDELEQIIASKPRFADIFDTADPIPGTPFTCPQGYSGANTPGYAQAGGVTMECLRVKPGMHKVAAFLETRRYAAMLGATTEFEKEEGITYDPDRNRLYVAYTAIDKGMTNDPKQSYNTPGHIAMPLNKCGAVFSYALDEEYVAASSSVLVYGKVVNQTSNPIVCDPDSISQPDNIHYFNNILFIAEDTRGHANNLLWAYNLKTDPPTLTRILAAPQYAEVTGQWMTFWGKHAYLTVAMQHPADECECTIPLDAPGATAARGYTGVIGPFDADCLRSGATPVFEGIPMPTGQAAKEVTFTKKVTYVNYD